LWALRKTSSPVAGVGSVYVPETAIPCEITNCYAVFHRL
jgi:hypothetical protein